MVWISYIPPQLRDQVLKALYDVLAKESEHPPSIVVAYCKAIESERNKVNNCDTNEAAYKARVSCSLFKTSYQRITEIANRKSNGDITPEFLATCDAKDLATRAL
ncbi:CIC_collapsed_G0004010.mRNA.1.CDS.1 [Saccharomyces cerevisiae]|nr:CIC_collapsed_G0004010.mRNA.1.CDS.1 [Saccharomyces cerevisiae]